MATAGAAEEAARDGFLEALERASKVTVLTGAGISAESGIPTFRGAGGLWRTFSAQELATPQAFAASPSLVWEFYHYRRCVVAASEPNAGHYAITELQRRCRAAGKDFTLLTQNIDGLHRAAGSTGVVELHGSLWATRCRRCDAVAENRTMPICPALADKGAPDILARDANIPLEELPRCRECRGLLRPHVVWFGEGLDPGVLAAAERATSGCQLLVVVGTSAVVYPAAGFVPLVRAGGGAVAEFNVEDTAASALCKFTFRGPSATMLPAVLGYEGMQRGPVP